MADVRTFPLEGVPNKQATSKVQLHHHACEHREAALTASCLSLTMGGLTYGAYSATSALAVVGLCTNMNVARRGGKRLMRQ